MPGEEIDNVAMKVREIIAQQLMVDLEDVKESARLGDDLGADSLDAVELIMGLESAFGIEIPDEEAEKVKTVGDTIVLVKKKLEETPQDVS